MRETDSSVRRRENSSQEPLVERPRRKVRPGRPQTLCHRITRTSSPFGLFLSTSALVRRPWKAPPERGRSWGIPPVIRPSIPLPIVRVPSDLAECTGSRELPNGKVRWQKKFAFPARRMRRGLRFWKTINSRKSTTNAKTNIPSRVPFTTDALHAYCRACSRRLSIWGLSATRSST